jgi:hypothetical protein
MKMSEIATIYRDDHVSDDMSAIHDYEVDGHIRERPPGPAEERDLPE